ncbi:MAG: class I SAM-dependent methyltransferase [Patescibacteria group bacterium]
MYPDLSDIEKRLAIHVSKTLARSTKRSPKETAEALLSWSRSQEFYDEMISLLGPPEGKKLLEIGCGYGLFLVLCLKNGIKAEGIEPANQEFYKFTLKLSKEILKRSGFSQKVVKNAEGESLPYKDNTFDVVASLYTLEHVRDVKKVLSESTRVLKPGGYLYIVVPNYGSFWEGHYGIFWIPYLPKFLAKIYVRLWSKKPYALSEYQLVNQVTLERYIINLPLKVHGWGNELFIQKVQNLSISGGTLGSAKKILRILDSIKLLKLAAHMASLLKAQTPIILVAKKK